MKQILQKLLMVTTILLTINSASAYDFEVDGIYYTVISLEDMTCKVVRGDNKYEGEVSIPAEVTYNTRSFSVTTIESEAFLSCTSLISVNIPNSVTTIGYEVFKGCSSLVSVNIPNSVTYIGYGVFRDCTSLVSVNIPDSVTYIGSSAFRNCKSLVSVNIPDSLSSILFGTFYGCSSLINISIPESVTSIEGSVFNYCTSLESITIPNSVTSLGRTKYAYYSADEEVFKGCSSLKSVILSNSLTKINSDMFSGCSSLSHVLIPNSITSIGDCAFEKCSSLISIDLPDALESIPYGLFNGCWMLKELEIPGSVLELRQYLYDDGAYVENRYKDKTFGECYNLEKLSLLYNDSHKLNTGYVFWYRTGGLDFRTSGWDLWTESIKTLYIDRELKELITVPNLEKLEIGEHMEKVQVKNISNLDKLSSIESHALVPPELSEMSNRQYMDMKVLVPAEALETYKADPVWGKFWNISNVNSVSDGFEKAEIGRYDLSGTTVDEYFKGFVIVRFSDGSTKKILQK